MKMVRLMFAALTVFGACLIAAPRPVLAAVDPKPTKTAMIFFMYTGDKYWTELAQDLGIDVSKAFAGYDRKVFLSTTGELGDLKLDLNEKARKEADVFEAPTKANFVKQLKELTKNGYMIDIIIASHGSSDSSGKGLWVGSDGSITEDYLRAELTPGKTGYRKLPIRAVMMSQCFGNSLNDMWRSLGAKATAGSVEINFYPNQVTGFVNAWQDGKTFEAALDAADDSASRTVVQLYLSLIAAPMQRDKGKWDGCPLGQTILGKDPCFKDYFKTFWKQTVKKDDGKEHLNSSSHKIRKGDTSIKKSSKPSWVAAD